MNRKRLTGTFILGLLFFLMGSLSIQAQKLSFQEGEVTLKEAFEKIEASSGYKIAYNDSQIDVKQIVILNQKEQDISAVLTEILTNTGYSFQVSGNYISILAPQSPSRGQVKQIAIEGLVVDEKDEAVIGATVLVKGTTNGTVTDIDGRFALTVPSDAAIAISYVGYESKEIKLKGQSTLKVVINERSEALEELVVVGYGVMNRRDVSTAISSVKSDQLTNLPNPDFRQSLQGKMAGVQVMQPSGDPEGNVSIRVRGVNTITAGSEPLYIVDGIPMARGFSNLNSNDIESVEVLKDASSAAIYGSRGSNGVILITTKSGKTDRLTVNYDGYVGVQNVNKKIALLDAYQFASSAKDGHDNAYLDANPGGSPNDPNSIRPNSWERIPEELFPYLNGVPGLTNTDWQDAIFRTAITTGHNLSFSGRGKNLNYFISANYMKKDGVVVGSDFEKYGARFNLDAKFDRFTFGVNVSPSFSKSNRVDASGVNGVVQSALMMPPVWPVYNPDGSFNYQGNGYWRLGTDHQHNAVLNPVAMATLPSDEVDRMSVSGKIFAGYEFFKGFRYDLSIGGDYYGAHNDRYRPSSLPLLGHTYYNKPSNPTGYSSSSFYFNWLVENKLTYDVKFGSDHHLNIVAVQTAEKETYKGNNVQATDYPNDKIQTISGGTVNTGSSGISEWSLSSYLARAQYSYQGKYMLTAAIRADGSSRFGKNNRWGYFPSVSGAWRISDESFIKNNSALSFIDDLKLRVSYGVTGNFNIGNYDHFSTLTSDNYILGTGNGIQIPGYKPDNLQNDDLRWEKNNQANVGFDFSLFKGLLGLSFDYYNTNTSDMLLTIPVPKLTGYSTALMNIGKVNNRGIELSLTSQKSFKNGFSYTFNANFAQNTNEVLALGNNDAPIITTGSVNHAFYITEVGRPIGSYYLLVQDGIFPTAESLNHYPHFGTTRPGDFRFVDVDGDGEMDLDKDRAVIGNYMPKFTYGFSGGVGYKGVDLNFSFQGVYGNKILNLNRRYLDGQEGNVNGGIMALDRWKSESDPGSGQVNRGNRKATGFNSRTSSFHVEDGSYLRLQNISVGYTLPLKITKSFFVQKLRVYFSGENLLTFSNYSGYNPEVNNRPEKATTPGEDYGTYPLAKVFTFGLNVSF